MPELCETLAAYGGCGYVLAPAGFGKTHLIAASVRCSDRRQLVLTHTYAGVNALHRKMRALKVSASLFHVDTIASWVLRLSLSYPEASEWTTQCPTGEQWRDLYGAAAKLLDCPFIRRIICASYAGLYVDEYQDCSLIQHEIVLKLSRDLPCRILGDPLQGIFDFGDTPVDWKSQVEDQLEPLGLLEVPHRWLQAGSPALGEWLRGVRQALESGQQVDLSRVCSAIQVRLEEGDSTRLLTTQRNACRSLRAGPHDTVIAIHKGQPDFKAKCHRLAKQLNGTYSSIEEIEGKDLFAFVRKIEAAPSAQASLLHAVDLAKRAMAGVGANISSATRRGEAAAIRANTKAPGAATAANAYLLNPTSGNLASFLRAVKETPGVTLARADLFNRAIGVLTKHATSPGLSLCKAAEKYQMQFRHRGRSVGRRRVIGTTLLVKGLEFQHAIVLDATSLSRRELYVALTRGAKTLTIISTSPVLNPEE